MAEMPNAIEPVRFRVAERRAGTSGPHTAISASTLETRKQAEPIASGDQTSKSACSPLESRSDIPVKVVTLKNSVPANWTRAAATSLPSPRAVRSCSKAAVVKKSEPTK